PRWSSPTASPPSAPSTASSCSTTAGWSRPAPTTSSWPVVRSTPASTGCSSPRKPWSTSSSRPPRSLLDRLDLDDRLEVIDAGGGHVDRLLEIEVERHLEGAAFLDGERLEGVDDLDAGLVHAVEQERADLAVLEGHRVHTVRIDEEADLGDLAGRQGQLADELTEAVLQPQQIVGERLAGHPDPAVAVVALLVIPLRAEPVGVDRV